MEKIKKTLKSLPRTSGVYIYRSLNGTPLYVGKAVDLSKRVSSYFLTNRDAKTTLLASQIDSIDTITTTSEFDALLLEAKLIREYSPKYNVITKDDKSSLYVSFTFHEELPRVQFTRKRELEGKTRLKNDVTFGPFQSAYIARELLRSIRRIIPYCTQKKRDGTACFYTHLNLCNPCPSYITKLPDDPHKKELIRIYRRNLVRIKDILSGSSGRVLNQLMSEMENLAKNQSFEAAATLRNQIQALHTLHKRRFDPSVYVSAPTLAKSSQEQALTDLRLSLLSFYPQITRPKRIECIDISNLGGRWATGSLVVLTEGVVDKSEYRRFKVKLTGSPHDTRMVIEVLGRRLTHPEWPLPSLLVIDGGKGQVGAAAKILTEKKLAIPVIGLAKRAEEIIVLSNGKFEVLRLALTSPALHLLEKIRDEAHRFAHSYHVFTRHKS